MLLLLSSFIRLDVWTRFALTLSLSLFVSTLTLVAVVRVTAAAWGFRLASKSNLYCKKAVEKCEIKEFFHWILCSRWQLSDIKLFIISYLNKNVFFSG